jgi:hypothetical protein
MTEDEYRMIYNHIVTISDRVTGRETRAALQYMLQLIDGLRGDLNQLREKETVKDG